jgi:hypothetical protein
LDGKKETLSDFKIHGFIFHRNMIIRVLQVVHIGGTLVVSEHRVYRTDSVVEQLGLVAIVVVGMAGFAVWLYLLW